MAYLELTKGFKTRLDAKDADAMGAFNWYAQTGSGNRKRMYAARRVGGRLNGKIIYLHRILTGAKTHQQVDHINGDSLDNRRRNLRLCSHGQNRMNSLRYSSNTSGFKGVSFRKDTGMWDCRLTVKGRQIIGGCFKTAELAAHAYDRLSKKYHGKFGYLNFPRRKS